MCSRNSALNGREGDTLLYSKSHPVLIHPEGSAYLVVDDATVALQDGQVRLGHGGGGFGGRLLGQRVVGLPGGAAEVPIVDQEQAGTQEKHEEDGHPVALKNTNRS